MVYLCKDSNVSWAVAGSTRLPHGVLLYKYRSKSPSVYFKKNKSFIIHIVRYQWSAPGLFNYVDKNHFGMIIPRALSLLPL